MVVSWHQTTMISNNNKDGTTALRGALLIFCLVVVACTWIRTDSESSFFRGGGISVEVTRKTIGAGKPAVTVDSKKVELEAPSEGKEVETQPETSSKTRKHKEDPALLLEQAMAPPLRFCDSTNKVRPSQGEDKEGFYMRYRCAGPEYEEFGPAIHKFAETCSKVSRYSNLSKNVGDMDGRD